MVEKLDSGQIAKARRISEIAEREKKATKGPWEQSHRKIPGDIDGMCATQVYDESGKTIATLAWYDRPKPDGWTGSSREENAEFIAHARADIPFLLSELASERQAVIEECCRAVCENCRDAENLEPAAYYAQDYSWKHKVKPGKGDGYFTCEAADIRSMGE